MDCSSAAARSACMHSHNSSSIERRPQFGSFTRSCIWIRALRMAFSSSLELGYVVLGLFFPFPNSLSTWQVRLRSLTVADNDRRSYLPLSPGTMSSILFAKHVSFEHSVSSPRPVITSRREKNNNNKAKVFQHPIDSQSASCSLISRHVLSARAVGARPRCSEFLSNRKYRYRSYTQTDDTHCWPWIRKAPEPQNVQQLRSWQGMGNFQGQFVDNLARLAHPLHQLLATTKQTFQWTNECASVQGNQGRRGGSSTARPLRWTETARPSGWCLTLWSRRNTDACLRGRQSATQRICIQDLVQGAAELFAARP